MDYRGCVVKFADHDLALAGLNSIVKWCSDDLLKLIVSKTRKMLINIDMITWRIHLGCKLTVLRTTNERIVARHWRLGFLWALQSSVCYSWQQTGWEPWHELSWPWFFISHLLAIPRDSRSPLQAEFRTVSPGRRFTSARRSEVLGPINSWLLK